MKTVCITMREAAPDLYGYKYDMLDQQWYRFFHQLNVICLPLPNSSEDAVRHLDKIKPMGVVLSGGGDSYCISGVITERDRTETEVLNWCTSNQTPVIGICRGMQVLLSLQNVPLVPVERHVDMDHFVLGATNRIVNSYHRYGAYEAGDFEILSKSPDGVIEHIQDYKRLHFGLMWHPERNDPPDPDDLKQFAAWLHSSVPNTDHH